VPLWLWPNVLGLDAPLVAVAWQHFFAEAFRVRIPPLHYAVLGLIVWVIYSADRVVDATRLIRPDRASHRHRFYRKNLLVMGVLTAAGAAAALYSTLAILPQNILLPGWALASLVALYFIHRMSVRGPVLAVMPKEVFSGIVFALGSTLLGFTWSSELPRAFVSPEVLCFAALCSLNCLAISVWEHREDEGNDPNAIAQLWPGSVAAFPRIAAYAAVVIAVIALLLGRTPGFPLIVGSATGAVLIAILAANASRFSTPALRVLADIAVLLPALAFLPMTPWASAI
jgi:hypothetical protein